MMCKTYSNNTVADAIKSETIFPLMFNKIQHPRVYDTRQSFTECIFLSEVSYFIEI